MQIIKDMTEGAYNAVDAARSTVLSKLVDPDMTPAHVKHELDNPEVTDALIFGSAFHDYILRPDIFKDKFGIYPEGIKLSTKEGKALKAEYEAVFGDNVIKHNELVSIKSMFENLLKNNFFRKLWDNRTDVELSIIYDDITTCKARIDIVSKLPNGTPIILDLKTSACASEKSFRSSIVNWGYHIQSAHYLAAAKAAGLIDPYNNYFIHAVCEKKAPYLSALYVLDDGSLDVGATQRAKALAIYDQCSKAGNWYGYQTNPYDINLPHWFIQKQDDLFLTQE